MKQVKSNSLVSKTLVLIGLSALLFSFSSKKGVDSFEIYLNKQLLCQQYVTQGYAVKSLQLDKRNSNYQLDVYYSHCGKRGNGRNIVIKDNQNKVLRDWQYADGTDSNPAMSFKVKDILDLQKMTGNTRLNLYYFSQELPNGRLLAYITVDKDVSTRP